MSRITNINIPASYLILIKEGQVLMMRRFNTGYQDGNYSLIAGHVDQGETFTQGMVREAKEEAGINIKPEEIRVVHVMHRDNGHQENNQRVDVFFFAEKWTGEVTNMEPEKCDDMSWFDLKRLPENTIPHVKHALEAYNRQEFYSELGWK